MVYNVLQLQILHFEDDNRHEIIDPHLYQMEKHCFLNRILFRIKHGQIPYRPYIAPKKNKQSMLFSLLKDARKNIRKIVSICLCTLPVHFAWRCVNIVAVCAKVLGPRYCSPLRLGKQLCARGLAIDVGERTHNFFVRSPHNSSVTYFLSIQS